MSHKDRSCFIIITNYEISSLTCCLIPKKDLCLSQPSIPMINHYVYLQQILCKMIKWLILRALNPPNQYFYTFTLRFNLLKLKMCFVDLYCSYCITGSYAQKYYYNIKFRPKNSVPLFKIYKGWL